MKDNQMQYKNGPAPVEQTMTKADLPGMLALAKAVQEGKWPHTTDAAVWAKEFMERYREQPPDEGDMIAWFANAIMAGYDTAYSQMNTSKK